MFVSFKTAKVQTMNGTIIANHVNHLDNFKKLHRENNLVTLDRDNESDNQKHGSIQKEIQDMTNSDDSTGDDNVSSLTSDSDSDKDVSLSDSSENEVEFFPPRKSSGKKLGHLSDGGSYSDLRDPSVHPSTSKETSGLEVKNNNYVTGHGVVVNGEINDAIPENQIAQTTNKLPRKLSPVVTGNLEDETKYNEQHEVDIAELSSSGLQSTGAASNNYREQSTSGSSDVVIPSSHNPPDLIQAKLSTSETKSEDSDLNDHTRILAELQKIVQSDETHGDGEQPSDHCGHSIGGDANKSEQAVKDTPESTPIVNGSHPVNAITNIDGTFLNGNDHNTGNTSAHGNGTNSWKHDDHDDGQSSTMKGPLDNNVARVDKGIIVQSGTKNKSDNHENELGNHGIINSNENGSKLETTNHGNTIGIYGNKTDDSEVHGHESVKNDQQEFDGGKVDCNGRSQACKIMEKEPAKNHLNSSNSLHSAADSSRTSLHAPTNKPANFQNQPELHGLAHLERKLSNLQTSNSEQTEEIHRLNEVNQALKAKFERLEQNSSYHQNIEEKMLKRNEELEKHLVGMLKSQEIIFDMKENLKVASQDNQKLTKDYKEAVKALEAVDKLVGTFKFKWICRPSIDNIYNNKT